jgi:hypothetical protein
MSSRQALEPTQLCLMGTRGSFLAVKRPEREANHSPLISAEVKKTWVYTPTPPYAFME